jgi:endonuclease YncB( thermonuclease family)
MRLRRLAAAALVAPLPLLSAPGTALAECRGEDGGSSLVVEIRGGDTLILQDGRAVRLFGTLLPRRGRDGELGEQARDAAERQISELAAGQVVHLELDAMRRDRYGRVIAQVFVTQGEQRVWLQEKLVAGGLARVLSSKDNRRCIGELLAAEKTARDTRQGHWATGVFSVKPAASEDVLAALAQSFEIVEGRVENVAEVKGRIYLNFGRNWRRDFTATIPVDAVRLFPGETEGLGKLKGQVVRVRGWIENVNGPSVLVTHPEQLETLTSGTASR